MDGERLCQLSRDASPASEEEGGAGLSYGLLTLGNATPPTGLFLGPPYRKPSVTGSGWRDANVLSRTGYAPRSSAR